MLLQWLKVSKSAQNGQNVDLKILKNLSVGIWFKYSQIFCGYLDMGGVYKLEWDQAHRMSPKLLVFLISMEFFCLFLLSCDMTYSKQASLSKVS